MLVQRSGSHGLSLGDARALAPDRSHRRREAVPSLAGMISSGCGSRRCTRRAVMSSARQGGRAASHGARPDETVVINSDSWSSGPACAGRAAKTEPGADAGPAAARGDTALIPNAPDSAGANDLSDVLSGHVVKSVPSAGSGHYAWLQRVARFSPFAWDVSWDDALHSPSAAGAVSAMTCAIRAASALGARVRTSCKRQSAVRSRSPAPRPDRVNILWVPAPVNVRPSIARVGPQTRCAAFRICR
jgi:hypothetical protein